MRNRESGIVNHEQVLVQRTTAQQTRGYGAMCDARAEEKS